MACMLAKFAIPFSAMADVRAILNSPDALEQAMVGAHLRTLIEESHTATWFTTQGLQEPSSSTAGSKAGDPLGDVVFTVLMTRVLNHIAARVQDAGLQTDLDYAATGPLLGPPAAHGSTIPLLDVSFLDDVLFALLADGPSALYGKIVTAAITGHSDIQLTA